MDYGTHPQYPYPQQPGVYPGGYAGAYAPQALYTLPPRRHSPVGVVSFVLSVMSGLALFGLVVAATVMAAREQGRVEAQPLDENSPQLVLIGLVFALSLFGAFVGLGLGVGGLFQNSHKRLFAILGLCLNGFILLAVGGLVALGMASQ